MAEGNGTNRTLRLRQRPEGRIDDSTFELVEEPVPEIGAGEALIRTLYLSIDPTNRAWIGETPTYLPPVGDRRGDARRRRGPGDRLQHRQVRRRRPGQRPHRLAGLRGGVGDRRDPVHPHPEGAERAAGDGRRPARNQRADSLVRGRADRQAEGGRDLLRVSGRGRGRLGRGPDREDPRRARGRERRAARRSATGWSRSSASTPPSTARTTTGARS